LSELSFATIGEIRIHITCLLFFLEIKPQDNDDLRVQRQ